jgi:hypothetical protein
MQFTVSPRKVVKDTEIKEKGYDKKLHAYAIRMLAELEDAQKEVSRLSVNLLKEN